jgi:hypothetical protein
VSQFEIYRQPADPSGLSLEPVPKYVGTVLGNGMRIRDIVRDSVVYVGCEVNGRYTPYGTGFLCSVEVDRMKFYFCATAAHVFDTIPGGSVAVRLNRKDRTAGIITVEKTRVIRHPDPTVDLVLLSIYFIDDIYDPVIIEVDRQNLDVYSAHWSPEIGDEVCAIGLYTSHYGHTKNIPIVRIGHIAAMPEEPIQIGSAYTEGYIIELHSIAGLSGSPVFVNPPSVWWDNDGKGIQTRKRGTPIPLGMLIGHHAISSTEDDLIVKEYHPSGVSEQGVLTTKNTGFGIVIPLVRACEMLETPTVRERMQGATREHGSNSRFVPDAMNQKKLAD